MSTMDTLMNNKAVLIGLSVLAFLIALLLVIALVRLLMGARLRMPGGRARQARLGIVDAFDLDRQRQLIIVRRDNTEHLIMIGGPNDLLIESEIIRMEARDMRAREKDQLAPAGDRIPAPFASIDRQDMPMQAPPLQTTQMPPPPAAARGDEPLLPMPLPDLAPPATGLGEPSAAPQRSPTFPLPPRRPVAPPAPAAADRRPIPAPRLPDGVNREEIPQVASQAPSPQSPIPERQVPPGSQISPPQVSPQVPPGAAARPSFLKPLPTRPPIKPLKRVTPQVPGASESKDPPSPMPAPTNPTPPSAPPAQRPAKSAEPPSQSVDKGDALDSLEEEMAKLLGRGPGG